MCECGRKIYKPKPPSEKTNWSLFLFTSIDVLLRPDGLDGPEPILQNIHRKMSMPINFLSALRIFSPWLGFSSYAVLRSKTALLTSISEVSDSLNLQLTLLHSERKYSALY